MCQAPVANRLSSNFEPFFVAIFSGLRSKLSGLLILGMPFFEQFHAVNLYSESLESIESLARRCKVAANSRVAQEYMGASKLRS